MRMDPRCRRINELSGRSQQLNRQLTERYLDEVCGEMALPETLCIGDYVFLACVGECGGGAAAMSWIARKLGINPSTATRQVNRLLADGLVTKSAARDDDRRYEIRLTEAGRRLNARMEDMLYAAIQTAYESVSEADLNVVYRFMEAFNGSLEQLLEK